MIEADSSGGDLSKPRAPRALVLDVDATHVPLHGAQERGFFHGDYDTYCDLPLYVFSGQDLLACVLRRLERWGVDDVLGLQKNSRLQQQVALAELALAEHCERRGTKHPKHLYDKRYCDRSNAENRIKEAQLDLFGRRASCHRFWANRLRLLLAARACTLMIKLRRHVLAGTELATACTATVRVRLLKIAAAIVRNTRRVRIMLASAHPLRQLFATASGADSCGCDDTPPARPAKATAWPTPAC